ncbi:MAG TPA: ADP-ribosylglycohydrolase family protein [Phycisphaerae bacterium]|nr:ADP-ribosylglycohydrolase family protein [Phycisphaerae bacterium]
MSSPIHNARRSLEGLSIGDAFGQRFFDSRNLDRLPRRELPDAPWHWTDDTAMACDILHILNVHGEICPDELAQRFADTYASGDDRGYGPSMHRVLRDIGDGVPWTVAAGRIHENEGSLGNGAAMRAGPVGACFAGDLAKVVEQARRSAIVTHAHPEGVAGAIAVAVTGAVVCQFRDAPPTEVRDRVAEHCLSLTPRGATWLGVQKALELDLDFDPRTAASALGSGAKMRSDDTVPFALWSALRRLDDFEEAMWDTVTALGDRDTTCAIVGSIVASRVGMEGIPRLWASRREPLPGI